MSSASLSEESINYVKKELYDVVCRSQSWMEFDMIIGGIDELLVETIWEQLGITKINSFAAYASFQNRKYQVLLLLPKI